jgi:hypothetical protein
MFGARFPAILVGRLHLVIGHVIIVIVAIGVFVAPIRFFNRRIHLLGDCLAGQAAGNAAHNGAHASADRAGCSARC